LHMIGPRTRLTLTLPRPLLDAVRRAADVSYEARSQWARRVLAQSLADEVRHKRPLEDKVQQRTRDEPHG
jgi:hypothetical protein